MGAAVEAEARVLALPHRAHVADPGRGHHQPHPRVAHPEGRQLPQLLGQLEAEPDAADHRVDPLRPPQLLGAEDRGRVRRESRAEGIEVLGPQRKPGGGAMAAESSPGARSRPPAPPADRSRECCARCPSPRLRRRARRRPPAGGGARPAARRRSRPRRDASPRRRAPAPAPRAAPPAARAAPPPPPYRPRAPAPAAPSSPAPAPPRSPRPAPRPRSASAPPRRRPDTAAPPH